MPKIRVPGVKSFPVRVDYDNDLREAITQAQFDYADPDIVATNFVSLQRGQADIEATLYRVEVEMTTNGIRESLRRLGLRPAYLKEAVASIKTYPSTKNYVSIAVIGSKWVSRNQHQVAHIRLSGTEKRIHLSNTETTWPAGWYIVAVKR